MADNKNDKSASTTEAMLAQALATIAGLMEKQTEYNEFARQNAPRRRTTMAEYLAKNPRKRLLHETFQNGHPVNPKGLSTETLKRLDTLATGSYCDGLLDVVRIKDGVNGINSRIHIFYNNKHDATRMTFYMRFPSFTKIVDGIVADMAAREIAPVNEPSADPIEEIVEPHQS